MGNLMTQPAEIFFSRQQAGGAAAVVAGAVTLEALEGELPGAVRSPSAESADPKPDHHFYAEALAPQAAAPCRRGKRDDLRPWTDEDRALLRTLHDEHLPIPEIALRLNRTGEAVSNMSRRLGLRRRDTAQPWSNSQLRTLRRMLDDGASLTQIAEATDHPRSSVADKLRRLDIKSQRFRRPWTDDERRIILTLHASGASLAAIAGAVDNRSVDAVQQKLQELGPGTN